MRQIPRRSAGSGLAENHGENGLQELDGRPLGAWS